MVEKNKKTATRVFLYSDFRSYLKDLVNESKSADPGFTMRKFAAMAGFASPSYLKMVIDGERSMTEASLEKFCVALGIEGSDKEYFTTLVAFNQCSEPNQKKDLCEKLDALKPHVAFTKLKQKQEKYLKNTSYACIREMVLLKDFKEDAKWIAARCVPRLKPAEAREAIDALLAMKLLTRDKEGRLQQTQSVLDTGMQAGSIEAFRFHEAALTNARRCLSTLKQSERHFSVLTIPLPESLEAEVKSRIEKFQDELLQLINTPGVSYDNVYQFNIQFFPVSKKIGAKEDK